MSKQRTPSVWVAWLMANGVAEACESAGTLDAPVLLKHHQHWRTTLDIG